MSKGYAEGSALEERLADFERSKREGRTPTRRCGSRCSARPPTSRSRTSSAGPTRSTRTSSSRAATPTASSFGAFPLPRVEQRLDVTALRLAELELREAAARLRRVVVRDRGLEPLAERRRLRELAAEPAEQATAFDATWSQVHSGRAAILRRPRPPSSSGLGRRPFTPVARVRIPLGVPHAPGPRSTSSVYNGR